jgi:hypothetical protein
MTVINSSKGKTWSEAVQEWEIYDCEEDESASSSCICGKENIRYLYTIRNVINSNMLSPIGSSCIKKFERDDLKEEISVREGMFTLLHAIRENEYISLSSEFFTRRLLQALLEQGAFKATQYNNFDGENDYQFLLDMFNKRNKDSITTAQHRKIRAILVSSIRPFLIGVLTDKIK